MLPVSRRVIPTVPTPPAPVRTESTDAHHVVDIAPPVRPARVGMTSLSDRLYNPPLPERPDGHCDDTIVFNYAPPTYDSAYSATALFCCGSRRDEREYNLFARTTQIATCVTTLAIVGGTAGLIAWGVLRSQSD